MITSCFEKTQTLKNFKYVTRRPIRRGLMSSDWVVIHLKGALAIKVKNLEDMRRFEISPFTKQGMLKPI